MDSHPLFTALCDALAALYPTEADAQTVVTAAGLAANRAVNPRTPTHWPQLLAAAINAQRLDALLAVANKAYGNNPAWRAAYDQYQQFIGQGNRLEPAAQPPGAEDTAQPIQTASGAAMGGHINTGGGDFIGRDKHIQGDEVHGDKVMGNKIIQEAAKPRVPLQRPPRAAHFQDRQADLAQLLADLQPGQVVTLCGPGGIGKSALAAEAVWHLTPGAEPPKRFPDGILFHSFYNQPQAALALEHIARSFGEELTSTPLAAAQRALAGRCALLLLDGTEQVDDLRLVVDLRDQCGVLVTSRQRKDQVDKRQDVAPLPIADAVTLLQAWGGGRAADTNAVQRISELVGRLPLALRLVGRYLNETDENAATYLTWLETTPLAALDQGNRREQSVPLLLARSLAQLSETARQVVDVVGLLALAPFDQATIAAALDLALPATLQALGELVNYGLLQRPGESYEVTHALIHTYARLQLTPATDPKVIERLADHYTAVLAEQPNAFARLHQLRPHVLTLLHIGSERQAWNSVSALAYAIDNYLDLQGYWTDRIMTLNAGLAAAQALQNRQAEGVWLGRLGNAYSSLGQVKKAIASYQQALTIAKEIGDRYNEGVWLGNLGTAYRDLGQREQAIGYYQQALAIHKEIGDRRDEGTWLGNLGSAYHALGQVDKAIEYFQQALVIAQEIGDRRGEGAWLGALGIAYYSLGQVDKAIASFQQALALAKEIGDRGREGAWLGNLGTAYGDLGQVDKAIASFQQALALAKEIGDRGSEGTWLGNLGLAYYSLGQVEKAIAYYQQALALAKEIGDRRHEGGHLGALGNAYRDLGHVDKAKHHWEQALQILEEIKSPDAETVRASLASLKAPWVSRLLAPILRLLQTKQGKKAAKR